MRLYLLGTLLLCHAQTSAQSVSTQIGSRANGIGYATAAMPDSWSLFNNPAGSAHLQEITAACTYDLRAVLPGANRMAAVLNIPFTVGVISAGCYRFGDDLYNEQLVSASFASKFGLASLGVQINYIQYSATGFGSKGVASVNLGGIAELTPHVSIGACIVNINQPALSGDEKLPTRLVAGIALKPIDKIFIAAEIDKDLDFDPVWKIGMEYNFHKKFAARTGYNLNPNTGFFGFGLKTRRLIFDYAVQYNVLLRVGHQASVAYQLVK